MWTLNRLLFAGMAILTLAAGSAWLGYSKGLQSGMLQVQSQWDAERLKTAQAHDDEMKKALQKTAALQDQVTKLRKAQADENRRIVDRYELEFAGLRNRPEARAGAGGVPEGAAPGVGCTGAGLAAGDARFLAWYAADAARLQLAFDGCRAQYEAVTEAGGAVP